MLNMLSVGNEPDRIGTDQGSRREIPENGALLQSFANQSEHERTAQEDQDLHDGVPELSNRSPSVPI